MGEGRALTLGSFGGRRVAVVGMGKSNQALARYLLKEGAEVTCFDRKNPEDIGPALDELSGLGAKWSLGPQYLASLPDFEWVFLTPGMKKNQPEIEAARAKGAVISSEIALLLDRVRCPVVAVTGSAGKTTTCTLAGAFLRESLPERQVYVGGNIGSVLIEKVDEIPEDAVVVLELSSFQLELVKRSPEVAAMLNVRPNHLDIHDTYEDYVAAKKNIYRFQKESDWCFLNAADPLAGEMAAECPGGTGFFSLEPPGRGEWGVGAIKPEHPLAWLDGDGLFVDPGPLRALPAVSRLWGADGPVKVADRADFLVPGEHNVANALAAALLTVPAGATPDGILRAIREFRGVEHRIEFVRELRGVKYYNDSIATSPDRTEALLDAISGPLVLILGGYDKGLPFDSLAEKIAERGCSVVTIGKTAPLIEAALSSACARSGGTPRFARARTLDEAIDLATAMARSVPGSSVALSPACASYDMFKSFEERGHLFKEAVRRLE